MKSSLLESQNSDIKLKYLSNELKLIIVKTVELFRSMLRAMQNFIFLHNYIEQVNV